MSWFAFILSFGMAFAQDSDADPSIDDLFESGDPEEAGMDEELEAAATNKSVFVAPLQAKNDSAVALSAMLTEFVAQELSDHPDLNLVDIESVGSIHDLTAEVYAASCPPGQAVGCAFVLAEKGGAEFAVGGFVETGVSGAQVEIHVIDVSQSVDLLSFQVELGMGDQEVFAESVAGVIVAVVRGEAGRLEDIRIGDGAAASDHLAFSRQLDQLSREIGDVTTLTRRTSGAIERPKFTYDDLAEQMENDGAKPWEQVSMSPHEYVRYQNSGLTLMDWRTRTRGRQGSLVVRPQVGFGRGPSDGSYYSRYAQSEEDLAIVQSYTWQAVSGATGLGAGLSLGFGLTPNVELGVVGGVATGRYTVLVHSSMVDQASNAPSEESYPNTSQFVGPQVLVTTSLHKDFRPVLGGRLTMWQGTAVGDHIVADSLITFSAPRLIRAGAVMGGEFRMGDRLDGFVHVPVDVVVAGGPGDVLQEGEGGFWTTPMQQPETPIVGASLMFGVQMKFFGGGKASVGLDAYGDPDEDDWGAGEPTSMDVDETTASGFEKTGIASFDEVFSQAESISERLAAMQSELDEAGSALKKVVGVSSDQDLAQTVQAIPKELLGSVQVTLENGKPNITASLEAESDVTGLVQSLNTLSDVAFRLAEEGAGLVDDVQALVEAAQEFPGKAPVEAKELVSAGEIKPMEAAKLPKKVMGNVKAMGDIPDAAAEVVRTSTGTLEALGSLQDR